VNASPKKMTSTFEPSARDNTPPESGPNGVPQQYTNRTRPALVIVSKEYGTSSGPEGICCERLANALSQNGARVLVFTVRSPGQRPGHIILDGMGSVANRPTRVQTVIGQLVLGAPVSHWDWVLRVGSRRITRPAVIYARGNPLASLVAGYRLAVRSGLPLVAHFSDPIPSPWEDCSSGLTARRIATVRKILDRSTLLTFTTPEAVTYMSQLYALDLAEKAVVVHNIVPDWPLSAEDGPETHEITYVGNFGGNRSPFELVAGLSLFNGRHPEAPLELSFVGTDCSWVQRVRDRYGDFVPIHSFPRTDKPCACYTRALISAVVDAGDCTPVFLATKTAEAVHSASRVLVVSPLGSPARRLFAERWQTVQFAENAPEAVLASLERLSLIPLSIVRAELPDRQAHLAPFRGTRVAGQLLDQIYSRISTV
jgi:hypothetical protein